MPDFDLTGELSLKIELHMLRPITEKVHSGNGPVSLVYRQILHTGTRVNMCLIRCPKAFATKRPDTHPYL